jgi:hypothetical protein
VEPGVEGEVDRDRHEHRGTDERSRDEPGTASGQFRDITAFGAPHHPPVGQDREDRRQ